MGSFQESKEKRGFIDSTLKLHQALVGRLQEGGHAEDLSDSIKLPSKVVSLKAAADELEDVIRDLQECVDVAFEEVFSFFGKTSLVLNNKWGNRCERVLICRS